MIHCNKNLEQHGSLYFFTIFFYRRLEVWNIKVLYSLQEHKQYCNPHVHMKLGMYLTIFIDANKN